MASTGSWNRPRALQAIVTIAVVVALLLVFQLALDVTWAVLVLVIGVTVAIGVQRYFRARDRRRSLGNR